MKFWLTVQKKTMVLYRKPLKKNRGIILKTMELWYTAAETMAQYQKTMVLHRKSWYCTENHGTIQKIMELDLVKE